MSTIRAFRSQLAALNVPSNAKPEIAIACSNPEILAMFKDEIPVVKSLVKASEVKIVADGAELPEGYLKGFVSDEISSYVKVVGLIDIKLEIARINKRVKQVTDLMEKAIKKTKMPGYETKVPAVSYSHLTLPTILRV